MLRTARSSSALAPSALTWLARLGAAALVCVSACRSLSDGRRTTVPLEAVEAFADARAWARLSEGGGGSVAGGAAEARERAREAARLAQALAPDWVAPRRLLDDFLREELLGLEALALHRRTLAGDPDDASALYLAGRLEGDDGARRFEHARFADPELSWAYHGLAFAAERTGELADARRFERGALSRARDTYERSYFIASLARLEEGAGRTQVAIELLRERLADPEVLPPDWVQLAVQLAEVELTLVLRTEGRRGYERALELLRKHPLTENEVLSLATRVRQVSVFDDPGALELLLALAAQEGALRDRLRADLLLGQRATPLALGLFFRAGNAEGLPELGGPLLRRARFAAGQFEAGIEGWLRDLPVFVLDEGGWPRDPRLAEVVRAGRELARGERHAGLARLGDTLVAAGWFEEARAVASELAGGDLDRALELDARATAGLGFLQGIDRLMRQVDLPADRESADRDSADRDSIGAGADAPIALELDRQFAQRERAAADLDELLRALAPLTGLAHEFLGGETDRAALERELARSPKLAYGFIGALVHPGPWFSEEDAASGRGRRGDEVPGLAHLLGSLGRFGVFGKVLGGGGPDGTVLQRVWIEERRGEHLGVPWSGTVAWCEGADVLSRAGRRGASISGAALHQGYWIDLERVRADWQRWRDLERRLADPVNGPRLERALGTRGLALETPAGLAQARRAERRRPGPLLGASELVRLAVLSDRRALTPGAVYAASRDADAAPKAGSESESAAESLVPFDEIVRVTAIHEEGHLCDRTRFLPLRRKWPRVLAFLFDNAFSAGRIAERLEYRAQLVAIAEAPDPRVPLVEVLAGAELGGAVTPHAAGYGKILADLLVVLDEQLAREPKAWPELDPERMLAHQLHKLGPGRLRELARELARREGLTR